MPTLLVRLRVADYSAWKSAFEAQSDARGANGSSGARLFRINADPTSVFAFLEWDDLDRARLFVQSDDVHEAAMAWTSAVEQPEVWFLDDADPAIV